MTDLESRLRRLAEERQRLAAEEGQMRRDALAELERVNEQIDALESRKELLEEFLGVGETTRLAPGQLIQLCLAALSAGAVGGMTPSQVKDWIERNHPDTKVSSVPATLSRLAADGRARRDDFGRYFAA